MARRGRLVPRLLRRGNGGGADNAPGAHAGERDGRSGIGVGVSAGMALSEPAPPCMQQSRHNLRDPLHRAGRPQSGRLCAIGNLKHRHRSPMLKTWAFECQDFDSHATSVLGIFHFYPKVNRLAAEHLESEEIEHT